MKSCTKCKKLQNADNFNKNCGTVDGFHSNCKKCRKIYRVSKSEYHQKYAKKYYIDNKLSFIGYSKKRQKFNKKELIEYRKKYYKNNKTIILINQARYNKNHKKTRNIKLRNRYKIEPNYKLTVLLRTRLLKVLNRNTKTGSFIKDLGCSVEELKQYLENQFKPGMTWENWSFKGWHIDHKIPLSKFDLTVRNQFIKAAHYTNLQPLWAKENLSKGNRSYYGG